MPIRRDLIIGPPNQYYVRVDTALGSPVFADPAERAELTGLLEQLRPVFECRWFAWACEPASLHLVLAHRAEVLDSDDQLHRRWARLGGRNVPPANRLRERLGTLSGLMQTLLQRYSRGYHRRHGGSGHLWAGRYRASLLADDAALLAAVAWLEAEIGAKLPPQASSHANRAGTPQLAPVPLRRGPGGEALPADEAMPGMTPFPQDEVAAALAGFADSLAEDRGSYGDALARAWALGHPEALSETLARLGRSSGRGRSRQLRELDDQLGLSAIWG